jgi:hypothetical protein
MPHGLTNRLDVQNQRLPLTFLPNERDEPIGFSVEDLINASESIRLGSVVLLVVGRIHSSGDGHEKHLDSVVT